MSITITEALAEIKTIGKRLEGKRAGIGPYIARQKGILDPLEKDGGSEKFVRTERQSIDDLEERVIQLRRGIARANDETTVTINGKTRTISEWLTWRRDVAPARKQFLEGLRATLDDIRNRARQMGASVVASAGEAKEPNDIVVNIDEAAIGAELDTMIDTLGQLDGQLSLKNATTKVDI